MLGEFKALGYGVIGISTNTPEVNREFAAEHGFQYPLICDQDSTVIRAYGACRDPTCASAARVTVVVGGDGRVVHLDPAFDPDTGPAELVKALRSSDPAAELARIANPKLAALKKKQEKSKRAHGL